MTTRQLATRIDAALKERVVAAVAALKQREPAYTLREACEDALLAWVQQIENRHNHGRPFPPPDGGLEAGRPAGRPRRSPDHSEPPESDGGHL